MALNKEKKECKEMQNKCYIDYKNKRLYYDDNYLIIRGVSSSSLLNDSLTIFFNHDFVKEKFKEEKIHKYQIDIKNIKEINYWNLQENYLKRLNLYLLVLLLIFYLYL